MSYKLAGVYWNDDCSMIPGVKCKYCPGYECCEWRDEEDDSCWYEPNDYPEGDIGSATVAEIRRQNGE